MSKKSPFNQPDIHPSRTVNQNWMLRAGSKSKRAVAEKTVCTLFPDGNHRILVSPTGVRTKCLCGAAR